MIRKKAVFNWSGGKDSAFALHKILQDPSWEVVALLTTMNEETATSSIHAIPFSLLQKQAQSIGIPLYPVQLTKNKSYEIELEKAVLHFKKQGVTHFIFGDLFLEEVRKYREEKLSPLGIQVVEPLWGKPANEQFNEYLLSGIQAKIIVTQADKLDASYIGKLLDHHFVSELPATIDPCGENGEYHSFAFAGGPFKQPISFQLQKIVKQSYDFKLASGEIKTFHYWQGLLCAAYHSI